MILNIYGASGSGKTTFIKSLLKNDQTQLFFESVMKEKSNDNLNKRISLSLIPLPSFRGTIGEFLNLFSIECKDLLYLRKELKDLFYSIFHKTNDQKLEEIYSRQMETLSAGEMRRLFLLKSLIVDSEILIVDEPFANSDNRLWKIIFNSINTNPRSIVLSHIKLDNYFLPNEKSISINIEKLFTKFNMN